MKPRTAVLLAFALTALPGCRGDDQETGSIRAEDVRQARSSLAEPVRAHLDSGNLAFRAGDLDAARRHYEAARDADPGAAAPWFGLFMVEREDGDTAAARAAIDRARELAPGATLMHPDQPPPGHP